MQGTIHVTPVAIQHKDSSEMRTVNHFWYRGWPDFDVPGELDTPFSNNKSCLIMIIYICVCVCDMVNAEKKEIILYMQLLKTVFWPVINTHIVYGKPLCEHNTCRR